VATNAFGLAGREWYVDGDPIHFNDRGAERMGEQMARALLNIGVAPARCGAVPPAN
jgi:lysophospholipase L1-like esterase